MKSPSIVVILVILSISAVVAKIGGSSIKEASDAAAEKEAKLNARLQTDVTNCHPKCQWTCDTPVCNQVCTPICEEPVCKTNCIQLECSDCKIICPPPKCDVFCPTDECVDGECPDCTASCNEPVCTTVCEHPASECTSECDEPVCDWFCHSPKECPKPKCALVCETDVAPGCGDSSEREEIAEKFDLPEDVILDEARNTVRMADVSDFAIEAKILHCKAQCIGLAFEKAAACQALCDPKE